jgi:hypothetical protein
MGGDLWPEGEGEANREGEPSPLEEKKVPTRTAEDRSSFSLQHLAALR